MNKTYNKAVIILIPIAFVNSLDVAKEFMGKEFKNLSEVAISVTEALKHPNQLEEDEQVLVYKVESFNKACEDGTIDNLEDYYTSTVYVE